MRFCLLRPCLSCLSASLWHTKSGLGNVCKRLLQYSADLCTQIQQQKFPFQYRAGAFFTLRARGRASEYRTEMDYEHHAEVDEDVAESPLFSTFAAGRVAGASPLQLPLDVERGLLLHPRGPTPETPAGGPPTEDEFELASILKSMNLESSDEEVETGPQEDEYGFGVAQQHNKKRNFLVRPEFQNYRATEQIHHPGVIADTGGRLIHSNCQKKYRREDQKHKKINKRTQSHNKQELLTDASGQFPFKMHRSPKLLGMAEDDLSSTGAATSHADLAGTACATMVPPALSYMYYGDEEELDNNNFADEHDHNYNEKRTNPGRLQLHNYDEEHHLLHTPPSKNLRHPFLKGSAVQSGHFDSIRCTRAGTGAGAAPSPYNFDHDGEAILARLAELRAEDEVARRSRDFCAGPSVSKEATGKNLVDPADHNREDDQLPLQLPPTAKRAKQGRLPAGPEDQNASTTTTAAPGLKNLKKDDEASKSRENRKRKLVRKSDRQHFENDHIHISASGSSSTVAAPSRVGVATDMPASTSALTSTSPGDVVVINYPSRRTTAGGENNAVSPVVGDVFPKNPSGISFASQGDFCRGEREDFASQHYDPAEHSVMVES
ncbi:unnamed protein product [Amoebophrya sp. A120]|nr:unnamed protein product [Amoebophrya sp. A120]|eukprot:GSA120T00021965001.1